MQLHYTRVVCSCECCECVIVCVKRSRKGQPSRPPSSRSVSRQKLHRLTSAAATARPPAVFNKNLPLPPIGTSAPTAESLSPGSNSSASVLLGLSATPAAETWSHQQCSSTLSSNVLNARVSPLANGVTVTSASSSHQTEHRQCMLTEAPTAETGRKRGSRHNCETSSSQQRAESTSLTADASGGRPLSQISGELSKSRLYTKATGSTEFKPDCSLSSTKSKSEKDVIDVRKLSAGNARLKVKGATCQFDDVSSGVKSCEGGTQANDDNGKEMLASAADRQDATSSIAHPLPDKTKNTDWWSEELVSASSILGYSPSPTCRLRCGANSRTARKFHGLNAHEIQTVSNVLNTIARSQSRAAASDATAAAGSIACTSTAESRVPTTERVRLPVSYNDCWHSV